MAFNLAYFNPIGGQSKRGKAPQMFSYATLDTAATVDGSGYFNAGVAYGGVYNQVEIGDVIMVTVWSTAIGTGGTWSTTGFHVVTGKASGTLDVTDAVALGGSDSD